MKVENLNMPKCFHFNPLVHYISTKVATSFHKRVVPNSASDCVSTPLTSVLACMEVTLPREKECSEINYKCNDSRYE